MNCPKCGNILNPADTLCPKCGQPVNNVQPVNNQPQPAPTQVPNTNQFNPQPESQPMMNNPYNPAPKKNNAFIIIIIVLVLAIIGVVLFFVLGNKDKTEDNTTGDTNTTVDNGTGGNNTQPTTVDNGGDTNTYTYENYEFPIPTGYEPMEKEESLYFIDQNNKVVTGVLSVLPYSYQNYVDYKEEIKTSGAEAGFDVKEIVEETHGNAKWLKIVATAEGEEIIFYFTKLDQYSTVQYMYMNQGNTKSDEQIFTEFANVFANAKYKGASGFSKDDSNGKKVDVNKFNGDLSSMLK